MKQTLRANLLRLSDLLGQDAGPSRASISRQALGDNTFFTRVERGENFTIDTHDRVVQWCSDNWPVDIEWPDDVPRPEKASPESSEAPPRRGGVVSGAVVSWLAMAFIIAEIAFRIAKAWRTRRARRVYAQAEAERRERLAESIAIEQRRFAASRARELRAKAYQLSEEAKNLHAQAFELEQRAEAAS